MGTQLQQLILGTVKMNETGLRWQDYGCRMIFTNHGFCFGRGKTSHSSHRKWTGCVGCKSSLIKRKFTGTVEIPCGRTVLRRCQQFAFNL